MHVGFVKLHRQVIDSGLMQRPIEFTLFSYLLLKAAYQPFKFGTKCGIVDVPIGGYVSSIGKLSSELCLSNQQIRTAIKNLQKYEILTCIATNKHTLYVIDNYSKYQLANEQPNEQLNKLATSNQQASNKLATTDKELNNLSTKEVKNNSISQANACLSPEPTNETKKSQIPAQQSRAKKSWRDFDYSSWGLMPEDSVMDDWEVLRKQKRAPISQTVVNQFGIEINKAKELGYSAHSCISECLARGWSGFKCEWLKAASVGVAKKTSSSDFLAELDTEEKRNNYYGESGVYDL